MDDRYQVTDGSALGNALCQGSASSGAESNALASNFLDSGREAVSQIPGERATGETLKWR